MTTPEHTLVGVHFALAASLHKRYGWPCVVLAGLVSNIPDLDGLPFLVDTDTFVAIHRIWGHNIAAILFTSLLVTAAQIRWDFVSAATSKLCRFCVATTSTPIAMPPVDKPLSSPVVFLVSLVCQLIHLPCDMVVSGGSGMADWPVRPWWPLYRTPYVYPMIPWGDPGPTIVLMAGLILLARKMEHSRLISFGTLVSLVMYLTVRRATSGSM